MRLFPLFICLLCAINFCFRPYFCWPHVWQIFACSLTDSKRVDAVEVALACSTPILSYSKSAWILGCLRLICVYRHLFSTKRALGSQLGSTAAIFYWCLRCASESCLQITMLALAWQTRCHSKCHQKHICHLSQPQSGRWALTDCQMLWQEFKLLESMRLDCKRKAVSIKLFIGVAYSLNRAYFCWMHYFVLQSNSKGLSPCMCASQYTPFRIVQLVYQEVAQ